MTAPQQSATSPQTADAVAKLVAAAVIADNRVRSARQIATIYRDRVALLIELSNGQRWRVHILDTPETPLEDDDY